MTLRDRLAAFWWHPTIDAMQARMLREIPRLSVRPIMLGSCRHIEPMLVGTADHMYMLDLVHAALGPDVVLYADRLGRIRTRYPNDH